jgi:GntR family carbon starvation induced transcriptional regulator
MKFEAKTLNAFDLLHRDIVSGVYAPDQPLRIAALTARYGVSATPLREALSRLAEKRLVVAAPNCGWRVAPVSLAEFEDLQSARLTIELALLQDAMTRGGVDWEAAIVAAHYRLSQAVPPLGANDGLECRQAWIAAHDGFHDALLAAAVSDWLKGFHAQLVEQVQRHHQALLFHSAGSRDPATEALVQAALSVARHTALKDVVMARDWPAAEAATRAHIAGSVEIYRGIFTSGLMERQSG